MSDIDPKWRIEYNWYGDELDVTTYVMETEREGNDPMSKTMKRTELYEQCTHDGWFSLRTRDDGVWCHDCGGYIMRVKPIHE